MAALIRDILRIHDELLEKYRDPRVDDWPLMNSFWQPGAIIAVHLFFVLVLGPKLMEKRSPFNLDRILLVYNAFQVAACFSLVAVMTIYLAPYYSFRCEPIDNSNSFRGLLAAKVTWYYLLTKVLDLLDTVFFVLRKRGKQISFLHVYHHAAMVAIAWCTVRVFPGGVIMYAGYINSAVHVFMYSYYFLSVYIKDLSRNMWLKKQMTRLQLLQFGLITISFTVILLTEDCGFSKRFSMFVLSQNSFIFYLFADFYYKVYIRKNVGRNEATKAD